MAPRQQTAVNRSLRQRVGVSISPARSNPSDPQHPTRRGESGVLPFRNFRTPWTHTTDMRSPHLLNLGNPRKVKENLSGLLDETALARIESEIERNAQALLALAHKHYRFAIVQGASNWRQKVSRLYYAGYHATRAVRLYIRGDYSTEVRDHQKFDSLPDDFPSRSRYSNQFAILREDRNICDYDHLAVAGDLVLGSRQATDLVRGFLRDVEAYLGSHGLKA